MIADHKTYINQLCEDTGCHLGSLPRAMDGTNGCQVRVKRIYAVITTCCWLLWWCILWYEIFLTLSPMHVHLSQPEIDVVAPTTLTQFSANFDAIICYFNGEKCWESLKAMSPMAFSLILLGDKKTPEKELIYTVTYFVWGKFSVSVCHYVRVKMYLCYSIYVN